MDSHTAPGRARAHSGTHSGHARRACSALTTALLAAAVLLATALLLAFPPPAGAAPRRQQIAVNGATLDLEIHPGRLALRDAEIASWVETAALAVATYYGRFPVPGVTIAVHPKPGGGVSEGRTHPGDPPLIHVALGDACDDQELERDWILTHELVHLGFPSVPDAHHWIEEGIATYVEPIARARIGQLTPEQVWSDLMRDLPQGLPEEGDRGLDRTPTWARTYWGGALFCLLADVAIRERSDNRRGLEHALAGIVAAGGTIAGQWEVRRAFAVGDAAAGAPVLSELYEQMRASPVDVDLATLFRRLGVARRGHSVRFDDEAPLAPIRRAITMGSPAPRG